jgi:hydroxymethylglutaryl-CoA lyase
MPSQVEIVEVSPRDGLQNEATHVSTDQKVELINRAIAAGAKRIEVTSFVNPKRVPQMADAEAVLAALPRGNGVSYIGLAMNGRGFDRALAAGVTEVNYVLVASDTFSQRNNGAPTLETLTGWAEVAAAARAAKMPTSITIGASFGCPFEGEVPVDRVVEVARRAADHGVDEIALADTIGVASPADVVERFRAVAEALPGIRLRAHFHNTRNTGIANAYAAVMAGVGVLDSSLGGIGGCPFAPAATGNIPTEDLVYMLNRMKIATGIDLAAAIEAAAWLEGIIGRRNPAMLGRAGIFPPTVTAAE